jgi:hypothetical protein
MVLGANFTHFSPDPENKTDTGSRWAGYSSTVMGIG